MSTMTGFRGLSDSLRESTQAIVPYLTAGYPGMGQFVEHLSQLAEVAPAVEIGIPFSDPMADGATIQESSRLSLASGTTLEGVVSALEGMASPAEAPLVVMSYLNPLLAFGLEELMPRLGGVGVAGLVIPDLPFEESDEVRRVAGNSAIGLVQMVTPLTDPERLELLCGESQGFVYAVTMTGTTGGAVVADKSVVQYLDRVRSASSIPVLAGFGVRTSDQVMSLSNHCDGVIVGSAIVKTINEGGDPVAFIRGLMS